ncbi:MAG: phospholipid carrier-dependent glycosyltransferase [Chloroflexi bacterium]|nr:phospholipid carrier-dependent glycosyltransferase [Chloroflexota bacterium]MCI0577730.1 phospholipid carrier-dependent glycosyltransferase [Chloroflexota bacterium]MCI0644008.1 phospholipid carrier-dependent glycosyltransferase [Chloroflexota bacterium]MCI0731993.1 phospholipid carrier-dependent glycosyltransferase [Chloroflexota bacterium]
MNLLRRHWDIALLLLIFVALGLAYSVANPLHEATDEIRHYRFVQVIATTGRLPVQGQEPCRSQSHHPPLFYALGALLTVWIDTGPDACYELPLNPFWNYRYWEVSQDNKNLYLHGPAEAFPWTGQVLAAHLARGLNVLIGAGVVWLTWATGRAIWPQRRGLALGAAGLVAFNPMFLYMAGAINNDIIAALGGTAVLYGCVRLLRDPAGLGWRWGAALGALYGLALLSKFNLAVALLLIEAAIAWSAWRNLQWPRHQWWRQWLVANLLLGLVAGVVAGWWFVRNQLVYGDPTGFREVTELWGARDPWASFGLALSELPYAWTTLWGRFGYGQIPLPEAIYDGLQVMTAAGLLGALLGFWRARADRLFLLFLAADVLLFLAVLFNYMLVSPAGPNGRFFFPALAALALLVFYGLAQLLEEGLRLVRRNDLWRVPARPPGAEAAGLDNDASSRGLSGPASFADRRVAPTNPDSLGFSMILPVLVNLGFLALALVSLVGYLAPAYARPPSFPAGARLPNPVEAHFDGLATLLGYEVSATTLRPGEPVDVTLYWQVDTRPPGDYLLFVHLIDNAGVIAAQRDTHPGLGNFPASQWRPGDRFVETIRLYLPETAYTPATATLSVGLYAPGSYRLAVTGGDGRPLGDAFELAQVQLAAAGGPYPNPQNVNFNGELRLIGYEYSTRQARPEGPITITLYWEALRDVSADYVVQVSLIDDSGFEWDDGDDRPAGGERPTNTWKAGEIIVDPHQLTVDDDAPPGGYPMEIALLDIATEERQNIIADDGHWLDNRLLLARIRVLP